MRIMMTTTQQSTLMMKNERAAALRVKETTTHDATINISCWRRDIAVTASEVRGTTALLLLLMLPRRRIKRYNNKLD